jgi:hypothetical protein
MIVEKGTHGPHQQQPPPGIVQVKLSASGEGLAAAARGGAGLPEEESAGEDDDEDDIPRCGEPSSCAFLFTITY